MAVCTTLGSKLPVIRLTGEIDMPATLLCSMSLSGGLKFGGNKHGTSLDAPTCNHVSYGRCPVRRTPLLDVRNDKKRHAGTRPPLGKRR